MFGSLKMHGIEISIGPYSRTGLTENKSLVQIFKHTKLKILFLQETIPTAIKPSGCRNRARVCQFLSLKFLFFGMQWLSRLKSQSYLFFAGSICLGRD